MGDNVYFLEKLNKKRFAIRYLVAMLIGIGIMMFLLMFNVNASVSSRDVAAREVLAIIITALLMVSLLGSLLIGYGFRQSHIIWSGTRSGGTEVEDVSARPVLGGLLVGFQLGFVITLLYFVYMY